MSKISSVDYERELEASARAYRALRNGACEPILIVRRYEPNTLGWFYQRYRGFAVALTALAGIGAMFLLGAHESAGGATVADEPAGIVEKPLLASANETVLSGNNDLDAGLKSAISGASGVKVKEQNAAQNPAERFLGSVTVNGYFIEGSKSRLSLNGQTYRVGEAVDAYTGLKFIGFHQDRQRAAFQTPDGKYFLLRVN